MSQDLFAAFSGSAPSHASQTEVSLPNPHVYGSGQDRLVPVIEEGFAESRTQAHPVSDDEDDFGEFEDAPGPVKVINETGNAKAVSLQSEPSSFPPKASKTDKQPEKDPRIGKHPFAEHMDFLFSADDDEYDAGADELDDLAHNPEAAMAYSKRILAAEHEQRARHDHEHSTTVPVGGTPKPFNQPPVKVKNGLPKNADVLFDVENPSEDSEDDTFGDFEGSSMPEPTPAVAKDAANVGLPEIDLLALSDEPLSSENNLTGGFAQHNHIGNDLSPQIGINQRAHVSKASHTATEDDDNWDDFETAEPPTDAWNDFEETDPPNKPAPRLQGAISSPVENYASRTTQSQSSPSNEALPPPNVPPPVVLLSIFPSILNSAKETLFDPLSKLDSAQRQQLLTHTATVQFLDRYLSTAIVLGHIVAGRKLRWKRDQFLAQSMRIGPAGAGGRSGMKLAGLDKSELAKEEREMLDAVRIWKALVGKLRGAVATASTALPPGRERLSPVPEIAEQMPVKTLRAVEGGFVAPQACALCGLKRDERVAKVDTDVNDSFGEWWVQGTNMHVTCRDFWQAYKSKLKSR